MTDQAIANRVREAGRIEPGASLRARVLETAAPLVRPSVTWADRAWCSRAWRLATVAAVLGLVALEQMTVPASDKSDGPPVYAAAAATATEDAARQLGMPPEEAKAFGRRAMADALAGWSNSSVAQAGDILPEMERDTR